jgi:hypothetical protein
LALFKFGIKINSGCSTPNQFSEKEASDNRAKRSEVNPQILNLFEYAAKKRESTKTNLSPPIRISMPFCEQEGIRTTKCGKFLDRTRVHHQPSP